MPNFTARIHGELVSTQPWFDLPTVAAPSRINPVGAFLLKYQQVVATIPSTLVIAEATVGGVESPLDGALGGNLFQMSWAKWSGLYPPPIIQTPGQSSHATFALYGDRHVGHFILLVQRPSGGGVLIPFNVE